MRVQVQMNETHSDELVLYSHCQGNHKLGISPGSLSPIPGAKEILEYLSQGTGCFILLKIHEAFNVPESVPAAASVAADGRAVSVLAVLFACVPLTIRTMVAQSELRNCHSWYFSSWTTMEEYGADNTSLERFSMML